MVELNSLMNKFRLASRDLYNNCFREIGDELGLQGLMIDRFDEIEALLFSSIVLEPMGLDNSAEYKRPQPGITAIVLETGSAQAFINRDVKSGYWDFPITEVTKDTVMLFASYFDWDSWGIRDNHYVRVQIKQWDAHPDTVGKFALIPFFSLSFRCSD